MKLKTKRLLAAALAISLTANISLAAFAVTYDLSEGSVTITDDEDERGATGVWSYQNDIDNGSDDTTITITTKDVDEETNEIIDDSDTKETHETVTIDGDFSEVEDLDITIKDADIIIDETDVEDDAAITIEKDSVVDLTIEDTTITVDKENASGIEIGTGSDVDMTLSGDNEIILNEGLSSGIQVGTTDAEDGENTIVDITIDGTTTIGEGVNEDGTSKVVNKNTDLTTVANMTGGITVGGKMKDGADGVDSDESGTSTKVTITSGEDGGTLNIGKTTDEEGNTVTEGVSTGILVHDGASVIIGDEEEPNLLEVNIDGTHRTYANVENNHTNDTFVTVSGNGIAAYGDVTITGNTEVNITDSDLRGISMSGSNLEISDGATVKIDGVGGESDGLEQKTISGATTSGTSNTYAGIYASNSSVLVDDATVNVSNIEKTDHSGSSYFGITLDDSTGTASLVVTNGSKVDVSKIADGYNVGTGIGVAGNNLLEVDRSTVTVSNTKDGIYLNKGALLFVHSTKLDDKGEAVTDENGETVTGETNLVLQDLAGNAITAYGADVEFIGDQVLVKIKNADNTGITMGVPTDKATGKFTDVDEGGIVNERHLYVKNGAQLVMEEVGYVGILVGNENGGSDYNKVVEITGDAYVKIGTLDGKGNSIILWGGNNSLLVDDSTVEVEDDITFLNTMGEDPSTITINNGSKVVARSIRNYNGGVYNFYITGGTVEVGEVSLSEDKYETSLNITDATSLAVNSLLWPTSGEKNGDEKLTNFRLSVSQLEDLLGENIVAELKEAGAGLSEEDKEKYLTDYGFVIEYDEDGNPTTLTFETYGADSDGNYIVYNKDGATNMTYTEWYVVDLTKYTEEELEDLWVWTPAVVLSYFTLNEGKTLDDAEDYDEADPSDVSITIASNIANAHDVVVRGQSLDFGNFQTKANYETTDLGDTAYAIYKAEADKNGIVLYIYDAMDEGKAVDTVSEEDLEGRTIIVQGEDGKYYLADSNGEYQRDEDGEIIAAGTYYYAVTDADGNFIRVKTNDAGYIVLDENGNFILDDDGAYVYTDEDGNLLNVELDSAATDAVRIIVSGTGYALPNANGTYSSTDADGNPVTAETAGAVQVATAVYYYAQVDEDGNYITDADGNYVYEDENGNVLSSTNSIEFVLVLLGDDETYVLYEGGKFYLVNANGEKTVVVNGEEIDMASLWKEFTSTTRVRSNAQAEGKTYNFENIFGGKGKTVTLLTADPGKVNVVVEEEEPGDTDEPGDDDPGDTDEPTPTDPTDPDEPEPIIPIVPVVPADPSTPAQPETPAETPAETPEETPAETPADPEAPAETPEAPASSTPKTGDDSNVAIYLVMAALSGAALIGLGVTGRKKNEEV